MWVKGSGADMRGSVLSDYPGLRLPNLTALRDREEMSDEEMTDLVTRALLDPASRRPSIETLLHAFLPFRHIDHVHADAICALTNHAEGRKVTMEALGEGFAYVDWLRPGFELSKIVGELGEYEGVVLAHHGLVTWAEDSDACYARTIDVVDKAREFVVGQSHRSWTATASRGCSRRRIAHVAVAPARCGERDRPSRPARGRTSPGGGRSPEGRGDRGRWGIQRRSHAAHQASVGGGALSGESRAWL